MPCRAHGHMIDGKSATRVVIFFLHVGLPYDKPPQAGPPWLSFTSWRKNTSAEAGPYDVIITLTQVCIAICAKAASLCTNTLQLCFNPRAGD
eukprot:jgi/Chlat1/3167/Chrsp22S03453